MCSLRTLRDSLRTLRLEFLPQGTQRFSQRTQRNTQNYVWQGTTLMLASAMVFGLPFGAMAAWCMKCGVSMTGVSVATTPSPHPRHLQLSLSAWWDWVMQDGVAKIWSWLCEPAGVLETEPQSLDCETLYAIWRLRLCFEHSVWTFCLKTTIYLPFCTILATLQF